MLRNDCILRWGILRSLGIPIFLKADSRLTLLGESIADLLEILCLFGADGRPTLLGRVLLNLVLLCGEWR